MDNFWSEALRTAALDLVAFLIGAAWGAVLIGAML